MLPLSGNGDPGEFPLRLRATAAVVPVLFGGLSVVVHPAAWVIVAALVAVSPWLIVLLPVRLPAVVCSVVPLLGTAWLMSDWERSDLSLMLLVYLVGQAGILLRPPGAIATWLGALAIPLAWDIPSAYDRSVGWMIGLTFACVCGLTFRKQQETMERLQEAQEELAEKAALDERRRIAREVHDLVAHSLAVTMLHLTGARLALADGETAEAEAALLAAERLGRSSMTGIRQAVGLLTDSGESVSWGPEPDVTDLPALVDDYRRAGVDVLVEEAGTTVPLQPAVGLTVFRLVQESLANAVRHAPGLRVAVALHWSTDDVVLNVTNEMHGTVGEPATPGHGLIGMRERVEQLGGRFSAGPCDGTWQVTATLPLSVAAETTSQ